MNTAQLRSLLAANPDATLAFLLPDGGRIPAHAHITEVGRVDKSFLDCGGQLRKSSVCRLQSWVDKDVEHRLLAGKLALILARAEAALETAELDVELEYEGGLISQFPVVDVAVLPTQVLFRLGSLHTDCLAKEICLPQPQGCAPGSGCC